MGKTNSPLSLTDEKVAKLDIKIAKIEKILTEEQAFLDKLIAQKQSQIKALTTKINFLKGVKLIK